MTLDEAAAILGPELAAQAVAIADAHGPLSPQQVRSLARLLDPEPVALNRAA